uniref:C3H1-type domain-containing protein n=2 Tax=Steinernema glaseri TaxID=37863 RepID=A0A1I8A7G0_9BILA
MIAVATSHFSAILCILALRPIDAMGRPTAMAEPMSDDEGEVIDRISSSSPEDISEETDPEAHERVKRPPMTPPSPQNGEDIEDDISDVASPPRQPNDASSDSNNMDDNDNLDYSDCEGDVAEEPAVEEKEQPMESDSKKDLSDGELEEGELESDSEDDDNNQNSTVNDAKRRSVSRSTSRSPPPKRPSSRNDGICKFYLRGNCTWGATCKFYHPTDSECERLRREEGIDGRRSITRVYQRAASPAKGEDAWERGLKQARERMKKASELKKDPDFDKKRLLMSASSASPRRRSDSEDSMDRTRSRSPPNMREKSKRIPEPVPFFPVGTNGRPPSLIDVMRNEDRRRTEAMKDLGPQVLYPSRDRDRNRGRRSNEGKAAPVPLREVAAAPRSGQTLRDRCRQREIDQQAKRDRAVRRSPSSRSSAEGSEKRGRKRRQERSRPRSRSRSRSRSASSRGSQRSRSSSSDSSPSSSRSSSRSSGSRSSSRSSVGSDRPSRRSTKNKGDKKVKSAKRRDPTTLRSLMGSERGKDREASSAADLSSFRIPKRRRSQRSESRSRSPVSRNRMRDRDGRRQTPVKSRPNNERRRRPSKRDDAPPAAYRSNVDPLFGLEGIPLSPEGDPISSDDEPDPKRDEVIRERDRIDNISDSSESSSRSSSNSSSSEGEEEPKSSSSSIEATGNEIPAPPEPMNELDEKERRRQELLDQLRSVEEAIARKRGKLTV